ncbi:MAG: MBL fold metallo-hydrolase [Sphaerochaetaceae bacterium]|nr:MBL fold metallo-hydrolase [Sphaerochaetaceae bacterium]MDD3164104.1 MBL fold metallo-hydrolase [Sphaerochaetaceae bacterium]MDD4396051.1 MBL fold metallo-hydrolase [Sphaerochaetaceae bacterium]
MELEFSGAARQVTGSLTILRACGRTIMIDCGLQQGGDEAEWGQELPLKASEVDSVLLTHAHIDHSGRIPMLYKDGYEGLVHCTGATEDLCSIMLLDSAYIQENDAEWQTRKALRAGKDPVEPIYTVQDAQRALQGFESHEYNDKFELFPGIQARFVDAGHLLGSASIELSVTEGGRTRKLVFSGDIGNLDQPIINDPEYLKKADAVVMESTYGDRKHDGHMESTKQRADEIRKIVEDTFARGGNVIIPSFSVGRTQEILYIFRYLYYNENFSVPVFVDSPLSVKATGVFSRNIIGYFDEEAMKVFDEGQNPILFPNLITVTDVADSKALNDRRESSVIISSSGMCEAGRIRHHLKHNLWRRECSVVFTGYQAPGTLGNKIESGAQSVKIFGEDIAVRAQIFKLEGISGHADKDGLIRWLEAFDPKPAQVFVVHGEQETALKFTDTIRSLGYNADCPSPGDICQIAMN